MTTITLHCTVPFPKDGLPCPVCNRRQRDTSSFKIHARKVHKTLDAQTPTTCSECSREFLTFRAASAHFARTHLTTKPAKETTTPSSPSVEEIVTQVLHRSPPLTCKTIPRRARSPASPCTQDLIQEFLASSPLGTPRLVSPRSCDEPTPTMATPASRSPSPEIAPPIPVHSRSTICPNPETQVNELVEYLRRSCQNKPAPSSPDSQTPSSPGTQTPIPSSTAREHMANLHRLKNAAMLEDPSSDAEPDESTPPPRPSALTDDPHQSQRPRLDVNASQTNTPNLSASDDPDSQDCDSSVNANLPTNNNGQLAEFQKHWLTTFAADDLPWDDFETQCGLFADSARILTNNLNPPPKRPNPPTSTNTHRPRGSRPTKSFNPVEARRIQGMYRHSKKRAARKILSNNSTTYTGSKQTAEDFFTQIFAHHQCDGDSLLTHLQDTVPSAEEENNHLADDITEDEVKAKLRSAANTAPGPDRVEYQHLKRSDPHGKILTLIFNRCLRQQNVPQSWKDATTVLIHKKDNPSDPSNFRPIALMSCIYKLFMGVLGKRLSSWALHHDIISNEQKSARPSEGCYEHTFLLKSIIRDSRVNKRSICVAWLDLRNAFGSIPHNAIKITLQHIGVPEALVSLITNAYTSASTTIRTNPEPTDPIPILSGVKQGCPLSAILFNLCIEVILRAVKKKANSLPKNQTLRHYDTLISCLAYADDLVLVARSKEALQALLDTASSHASILGLRFRPDKCATLTVVNRKGEPTRIDPLQYEIQRTPIPALAADESYRYLGVPIGLIHNIDDLDRIIPQLILDLDAIRSSHLAPWQKLDAIRTFIQPALTYALRAGDPQKQSLTDYQRTLVRTLREICNLPQRSTQPYFFASKTTGGLALQDPSAEVDIQCIVQAVKILSSADPITKAIAQADLRAVVRRSTSSNPSANILTKYLSGSTDNPLGNLFYTHSSLWSRCRKACRRLQITFHFSDTENPTISTADSDRIRANAVTGFLHRFVQQQHGSKLLALPDQGKVAQCLATDHYANGSTWHNSGLNLRFKDWRFIHKARLNCLPTNATKARWSPNTSPTCRHCQESETLPHILNHCRPHLVHIRERHNKIVTRITDSIRFGHITTDRTIQASGLPSVQTLLLKKTTVSLLLTSLVPSTTVPMPSRKQPKPRSPNTFHSKNTV